VKHSKHNGQIRVRDLASHDAPFLTTGDLAEYWCVSKRHIHKQIEQGNLPAVRLGPRSLRISTDDAIEFERRSRFAPQRDQAADSDRSTSRSREVRGRVLSASRSSGE
jgi:excisionase family DNA binding protein